MSFSVPFSNSIYWSKFAKYSLLFSLHSTNKANSFSHPALLFVLYAVAATKQASLNF